jgi:hypothetical protein
MSGPAETIHDGKPVKISKAKDHSKKKSYSLGQKYDETSSCKNRSNHKDCKRLFLDSLEENGQICNTLPSNRVFVGNKTALINSARV